MKFIISVLKNIIFAFFILYGFNIIGSNFNIIIPINFITVLLVCFLGFPALFILILLYLLVF